MKIGVLINARLGSTRLYDKQLIQVKGESFLKILVKRVQKALNQIPWGRDSYQLIIATSPDARNIRLKEEVTGLADFGVGSEENVPLRQLQIAEQFHLDGIVSVDGDDILIGQTALVAVVEALRTGEPNVKTVNLPLGMNVSGYSRAFLKRCLEKPGFDTLDTNWGRLFSGEPVKEVSVSGFETHPDKLRLTLDYPEDQDFFESLICKLPEGYLAEDEAVVQTALDAEIFKKNQGRIDEYWARFHSLS